VKEQKSEYKRLVVEWEKALPAKPIGIATARDRKGRYVVIPDSPKRGRKKRTER